MCGPAETPEKLAMSTSIDNEDIESLEKGEWIQDACIRHIICEQLNLEPEQTRKGYNVVDPSWIAQWESYGCYHSEEPPAFLTLPNGEPVRGLAIPVNIFGLHWVSIHVSFENSSIHVYDSLTSLGCAEMIEMTMFRFASEFRDYFNDYNALIGKSDDTSNNIDVGDGVDNNRYYPDEPCAQQHDVVSCGIYTCVNVIRIMRNRPPIAVGRELCRGQILKFRKDETAMMKERKALGDIVFDIPLPLEPVDPAEIPLPATPPPHDVPLPSTPPPHDVPLPPSPPPDENIAAAALGV